MSLTVRRWLWLLLAVQLLADVFFAPMVGMGAKWLYYDCYRPQGHVVVGDCELFRDADWHLSWYGYDTQSDGRRDWFWLRRRKP